jgi:hypothetical protein
MAEGFEFEVGDYDHEAGTIEIDIDLDDESLDLWANVTVTPAEGGDPVTFTDWMRVKDGDVVLPVNGKALRSGASYRAYVVVAPGGDVARGDAQWSDPFEVEGEFGEDWDIEVSDVEYDQDERAVRFTIDFDEASYGVVARAIISPDPGAFPTKHSSWHTFEEANSREGIRCSSDLMEAGQTYVAGIELVARRDENRKKEAWSEPFVLGEGWTPADA